MRGHSVWRGNRPTVFIPLVWHGWWQAAAALIRHHTCGANHGCGRWRTSRRRGADDGAIFERSRALVSSHLLPARDHAARKRLIKTKQHTLRPRLHAHYTHPVSERLSWRTPQRACWVQPRSLRFERVPLLRMRARPASGSIAQASEFAPFDQALAFARTLGLASTFEWREWCREGMRPPNVPSNPHRTYKGGGWQGCGHWLGTGNQSSKAKKVLAVHRGAAFGAATPPRQPQGVAAVV